jgi:hypothetical protein
MSTLSARPDLGPARLRLHFPAGSRPLLLLEALAQAVRVGQTTLLEEDDIRQAAADAADLRAEFTGLMERVLPGYEDHLRLLREAVGRARGRRRTELQAQLKHLRESTRWLLRTHLNRYYADQFILGKRMAGSARGLQANEREILRRLVNNEAEFLLNALLDAETGEYHQPLGWRGRLYGNAVDEAKWLGFLYADLRHGRYVRWRLSPSEHCVDCLYLSGNLDLLEQQIAARAARRDPPEPTEAENLMLAAIEAYRPTQGGRWGNGVYRVQELARMGIVPQSGRLACTTNCKCWLEEVERPAGPPRRKEARHAWESLLPKRPTMLERETRRKERQRLAELAEAWEHRHIRRRETAPPPEHLHAPRPTGKR